MAATPRDNAYCGGYTPIRNRLRKFAPESVLRRCLAFLTKPTRSWLDQIRKQPWTVLLVVKWAFIDEQSAHPGRPEISGPALDKALQAAHELADSTRLPNEYEHVSLFMRTIAFQQFLYQKRPTSQAVVRQDILFADAPSNHWFRTEFLAQTGLEISDFNRLAFYLFPVMVDRVQVVPDWWGASLQPRFGRGTVDRFLEAVSVRIEDLPARLRADDKTGRTVAEYAEQTPFLSYPLIRIGHEYHCIYFEILVRSLGNFVYDTLKRADITRFNAAFGSRFEAYVGQILSYSGLAMATERELEKALPGKGGVVDFLLAAGDTNILIDAKGVEMAARGKVAHLQEVVRGATQSSLIKAVQQAHEVIARLAKLGDGHPVITPRSRTFLLVVTFKELYIGNGVTLANAVGQDALDRIRSAYAAETQIPLEHMYFITIEELETLVASVKAGKLSVIQALEHAMREDAQQGTRKFIFMQHLSELDPDGSSMVPALDDAESRIKADLVAALEQ